SCHCCFFSVAEFFLHAASSRDRRPAHVESRFSRRQPFLPVAPNRRGIGISRRHSPSPGVFPQVASQRRRTTHFVARTKGNRKTIVTRKLRSVPCRSRHDRAGRN